MENCRPLQPHPLRHSSSLSIGRTGDDVAGWGAEDGGAANAFMDVQTPDSGEPQTGGDVLSVRVAIQPVSYLKRHGTCTDLLALWGRQDDCVVRELQAGIYVLHCDLRGSRTVRRGARDVQA